MTNALAKVYVAMPGDLLERVDRRAGEESLTRDVLIQQAIEHYLRRRVAPGTPRFFAIAQELREAFAELSDEEIERRVKVALQDG